MSAIAFNWAMRLGLRLTSTRTIAKHLREAGFKGTTHSMVSRWSKDVIPTRGLDLIPVLSNLLGIPVRDFFRIPEAAVQREWEIYRASHEKTEQSS